MMVYLVLAAPNNTRKRESEMYPNPITLALSMYGSERTVTYIVHTLED